MTETKPRGRPKVNSEGQKELDKAAKECDDFQANIEKLTMDRMNETPVKETEAQTKLSQTELAESKDVYLKPVRYIASQEKFNERYRDKYNYSKEYVYFIAENNEIIGEAIECWTKVFPGLPAEFWKVPTNKPIWGPRYLAEQIKGCKYHRLKTEDRVTHDDGTVKYTGQMVVDTTIQRLDARPATKTKSIFMGATTF